jgi:ornithine decarboxylase
MIAAASIEELIRGKTTDLPVFCFYPENARKAARTFVRGFPGEVLYAVKANPEPRLLQWLNEGGIRNFDTASIREIDLVRRTLPGCGCFYNHPIKPRASIDEAYRRYGVRDFVVDHMGELDKLLEEVGTDLTVEVRITSDSAHARVSFGSKFGATPQEAVALLKAVERSGARPAMCMHVGYQTIDPGAFAAGLELAAKISAGAGVAVRYMNVGGGFPSVLMPSHLGLADFFRSVAAAHAANAQLAGVPLKCEPGSALAHPAGALLALVLSVKKDRIYLNDGIFGAMAELLHTRVQPPTTVFTAAAARRSGETAQFVAFGPTCDSFDTIPATFTLPRDVREGDWLFFEMMGAYSSATITDFNGLGTHEYAVIGD